MKPDDIYEQEVDRTPGLTVPRQPGKRIAMENDGKPAVSDTVRWIVNVKGAAGEKNCEISVVLSNNKHGISSCGWPDRRNKIIIYGTGYNVVLWPCVFNRLVGVAQEVAEHLNRGGGLCDANPMVGERQDEPQERRIMKTAKQHNAQLTGSASVFIQHERWMADQWNVMFQVQNLKFMIGAGCSDKQQAERLRDDFADALGQLGINLPND